MFNKKNDLDQDETTFDEVIEGALNQIQNYDVFSKEYADGVANLLKLAQAKDSARDQPKIQLEVLVSAGASLAGILAVLNFEKLGVITTKAFALIPKLHV